MTAREKMLERKLGGLEERLRLVERFVELRFSETFRDFSFRNKRGGAGGGGDDDKKGRGGRPDKPDPHDDDHDDYLSRSKKTTPARNSSSISSRKMGTRGKASSPTPSPIKVERSTDDAETGVGLRRSSRRHKPTPKMMPSDDDEGEGEEEVEEDLDPDADAAGNSSDEEKGDNDVDNEDSYFTYPQSHADGADGGYSDDNLDEGGGGDDGDDRDDDDWVEGETKDASSDFEPVITAVSSRKRKQPSKAKGPRSASKPKKKRARAAVAATPRKNVNLSNLQELVKDVTLVSVDPTVKECHICHKHFKLDYFESHMEVHARERHLRCNICNKAYYNANMLNKHKRTHQLDKYGKKCRMCEYVHTESNKVLCHERVCLRRKLQQGVEVAEEVVSDIKKRSIGIDLKLPAKVITPEEAASMRKCPRCYQLFTDEEYPDHFKSHTVVANWKCNLCDKKYTHKASLMKHSVTAHGPDSTKCSLCGDTFENQETMAAHRYKCPKRQSSARKKPADDAPSSLHVKKEVEDGDEDDEVEDEDEDGGADDDENVEMEQDSEEVTEVAVAKKKSKS